MAYLTKPFFHIVDTETTGLSPGYKRTGLLQLYSTNLPPYHGARPFDPRTLVKPATGYTDTTGNIIQFANNFAGGKDVLSAAQKVGAEGEEESARRFFAASSEELSSKRRFIMGAWNPQYDTGMLEAIAQRYPSLEQYRGFFQRKGVKTLSLEQPFFEFAHWYGKENPEFAQKHFRMGSNAPISATAGPGSVARSAKEMRYVPGWSVENVTKAAGGREKLIGGLGQFHEAVTDVNVEQQLFEKFRLAKLQVRRGYSYDKALGSAGLLPEGATAETFFKQIFSNSWVKSVSEQVEQGVKVLPPKPNVFAGHATKILAVAAATAIAYSIATSRRGDRQTQITGLSDVGAAAQSRHKHSDFGSGWTGPDNNSLATAGYLVAGATAFGAHKYALKNWAGYAEGVYQTLKKIEVRSPSELFKTFGLSQLQSSYLVDKVVMTPEQLFFGRELTETGRHVQRLLGINPIDQFEKTGMTFNRISKSSPYLELEGMPGYKIRFAERGVLTGSSARLGSRLHDTAPTRILSHGPFDQIKEALRNRRESQELANPLSQHGAFKVAAGGESRFFEPLFGRRPGIIGGARSAVGTAERVAFEAAQRPLRLLGNIGLGFTPGSYNKLFHPPGIGEGGLLNKLLLKRVLPAYLGVTAARYRNYQLGNKPAEAIAALPLKLNVARAELTDKIPGLRKITDKYEEIVPGPQYGPLALPIGAGVLSVAFGHYLPIARGTAEYTSRATKAAASHAAMWKGAKWGALAMLPFIPGMLGSRKTANELRREYSGEDEVPIRSGRWWDVGSTPFSGGRIKYFRPHWYSLMKAKSEMIATYGSQDAYWEHHPLLHPFKYIKDPNWLERANYYSRPYPVTSPAFSNVPLIGPALAATIGRVIKPVVRMHEKDWDTKDYTLYSPRLEPKGPIVESKLEGMVLQNLAEHGYQAQTQVVVGKHRLDMVVQGENGARLAIEPEGYSYHHTAYQLRQDKERAKILKGEGWQIANVASRPFFSNQEDAMADVYSQLDKLHIKPGQIEGGDVTTGLYGLAPSRPTAEFSFRDVAQREVTSFAEFTGLPGFLASTLYGKLGLQTPSENVMLQGSRQMTSWSRSYYQRELGAASGFNPVDVTGMPFGYSEPLRRFIQPERIGMQANEIPNDMPHWMPGADYMVDFRTGDPFAKVPEGGSRLPGPGYAALHPELAGLDPEDYPDMTRYKILADTAPYSKEYMIYKAKIRERAKKNTQLAIDFARTEDQVSQVKASNVQFAQRRFTAPVEKIQGTIKRATTQGVELEEYPTRTFSMSSLGMSAADLSALALGEQNNLTRTETAQEVDRKQLAQQEYLGGLVGRQAQLVVPSGTEAHAKEARAVIFIDDVNINKEIIDKGLASMRKDYSGAEAQAMYSPTQQALGRYAERMSFTGEGGPLRLVPTPFHTKYWNEQTALSKYQEEEVYGSRMRRWQKPFHDMVAPWARGLYRRVTGDALMSKETQHKRDLDRVTDELDYLRGYIQAAAHPGGGAGKYTSQTKRTNIGGT